MASTISSSPIQLVNYPIDMSFDLDEALTMPQQQQPPAAPRQSGGFDVSSMPNVDDDDAPEACSVCMEGFQPGYNGKRVPCGHAYHQHCIAEWSLRHNSCPLCRSKIFQEN